MSIPDAGHVIASAFEACIGKGQAFNIFIFLWGLSDAAPFVLAGLQEDYFYELSFLRVKSMI